MLKNTLFLFVFIFVSHCCQAQTLTAQEINPQVGDHFRKKYSVGLAPTSDGQNVVWNFSNFSFFYKDTIDDQMIACANSSNIATVCRSAMFPVENEAFRPSQDSLVRVTLYGNETMLIYPLFFGKSWGSTNTFSYVSNSIVYTNQVTMTGAVVGTGTLMTVAGVFPNVLKVRLSAAISTSANGVFEATRTWAQSSWYVHGLRDPVMYTRERYSSITTEDFLSFILFNIAVPDLTSIEEGGKLNGLGLYPNPNQGSITINLPVPALLTVRNVHGQVILKRELSGGETIQHIEELTNGVYLFEFRTQQSTRVEKVIVTK